MNKKKLIIIILSIVACLLIAGLVLFFILKDDDKNEKKGTKEVAKITITFDADGGSKVEDITVKKGSSFQLPETTKEGYLFAGWYNGSTLYTDDDTASIKKNIVLTAKWEEVEEDDVILTVTFDSKGGSKVKDMTFKCVDGAATLKNLPKSKKDSYEFRAWEDKFGKAILDGAKITCDGKEPTLKLYAGWEYDGPVANPEQPTTTTEPEKKKEYKCPEGYELKDTNKCVSTKSAEYYCETGKESNGTGSKVCYSWAGNPTSTTCKNGGTYIKIEHGDDKCGYDEVTRLTGNVSGCTNEVHGTMINNHCYMRVEIATESILNHTCAGTSAYRTSAELGNTANSGCYNLSQRTYGCKTVGEGYSYNYMNGKCIKTIDATFE